jgi:hypothetical protein
MLCQANVHLSDWPLGERREVDPKDEQVKGLLRAGFIVPLVMPRTPRQPTPVEDDAA